MPDYNYQNLLLLGTFLGGLSTLLAVIVSLWLSSDYRTKVKQTKYIKQYAQELLLSKLDFVKDNEFTNISKNSKFTDIQNEAHQLILDKNICNQPIKAITLIQEEILFRTDTPKLRIMRTQYMNFKCKSHNKKQHTKFQKKLVNNLFKDLQ